MRTHLLWFSLLATLLLSGCGEREGDEETTKQEPLNPAKPGLDPARPPAPNSDPVAEWEVEVFSNALGEQLDELKLFLKGTRDDLSFAEASSRGLTGFAMTDVIGEGAFSVRAGAQPGGEQQALEKALGSLRARFPDAAKLTEIKIVRVNLKGALPESELNVHLADEKLQINALWTARWSKSDPPVLQTLETKSYEECEHRSSGKLVDSSGTVLGQLAEVEQFARGMDHWATRIETLMGIEMGGWHGLAAADVNGDGRDDIYLCDGGGLTNRLLVQQADGSVQDQSHPSGLGFLDHSFGSLFADFDNDGDQDVAIAMISGVLIMKNDGHGSFTTAGAKSFPAAAPYSLSAADYDQDGDLDLFACCYVQRGGTGRHSFVARPVPYHDATNGGRNELLRNEGGLRFRNVTKSAGLRAGNSKFSFSGSWDDYDGDGDLDLYVANDFGGNYLYQNQLAESGQPTFKDVAKESGVRDVAAGMSTCWGDYDNDGLVDLYVGNMFSSAGNRIAFQDQFMAGQDAETRALYQRHARGNSLFRNLGGGAFEDVSLASGTTMGRWAWSSLFADIDNDGWEDILVSNGFITQADPGDL